MNVIDRVKAQFESLGIKKIEVAEWGEEGKPLIIYCSPFTLGEKRNLFKINFNIFLTWMTFVEASKVSRKT